MADAAVELVFRMDADDRCHPQRFLRQTAFMQANPSVAVSGCWARVIDSEGNPTGLIRKLSDDRVLKLRLPLNSPFAHPTVVFRAEVLRGGLCYPEDAPLFEDVALWSSMAQANCCFSNLREVLYDYRFTPATAQRRVGFAKAWPELRVRLTYIRRQLPWRFDLALASLVIFAFKILLPSSAFSRMLVLRARLFDRLDRLNITDFAEGSDE